MKQKENRTCGFCEGEGDCIVHLALDSAENIYETCPICKGKGVLVRNISKHKQVKATCSQCGNEYTLHEFIAAFKASIEEEWLCPDCSNKLLRMVK